MKLHWRLRIIIKIMFSQLPVNYAFWRTLGLFRHGKMDHVPYALKVFKERAADAGVLETLAGKTVLEIGPGDSISSGIIAFSYGASSILVDSGNFASKDIVFYKKLIHKLDLEKKLGEIASYNSLVDQCNVTYLTDGLNSLKKLPDASIDFIFSQAVLEHISLNEFSDFIHQTKRVLREGGICSHCVDLKDHLGGSLNNLVFNASVWESEFFRSSGFYTNRLRFSEMMRIFESAGFKPLVIRKSLWGALPTKLSSMSPEFRDFGLDDLLVSQFDVILR